MSDNLNDMTTKEFLTSLLNNLGEAKRINKVITILIEEDESFTTVFNCSSEDAKEFMIRAVPTIRSNDRVFIGVDIEAISAEIKFCPHAQRCVHPCDNDECFLETIEKPNGPDIPLTKEQCDAFENAISAEIAEHHD